MISKILTHAKCLKNLDLIALCYHIWGSHVKIYDQNTSVPSAQIVVSTSTSANIPRTLSSRSTSSDVGSHKQNYKELL